VCRILVNSNHPVWYFQYDTAREEFMERIKHTKCVCVYVTFNYNRLHRAILVESNQQTIELDLDSK